MVDAFSAFLSRRLTMGDKIQSWSWYHRYTRWLINKKDLLPLDLVRAGNSQDTRVWCNTRLFRMNKCAFQHSHNLSKFPQIYAVSEGVVLSMMRILCILFKNYCCLFPNHPPPVETRIWKYGCGYGCAGAGAFVQGVQKKVIELWCALRRLILRK